MTAAAAVDICAGCIFHIHDLVVSLMTAAAAAAAAVDICAGCKVAHLRPDGEPGDSISSSSSSSS
jgi:hypothetical protein